MPRFSRKSSDKESKKAKKAEKSDKSKKSKESKSGKTSNQQPEDEEEEDSKNGFIGVQRCRKLLASCPKRSSSAKCVATFKRKSRLSKTLIEVLVDDSILPYFMEYMQKQNAVNLLNYWLTAETFRLSTINRLKINSLSRLKSSKNEGRLVNGGETRVDGDEPSSPNLLHAPVNQSTNSRERILSDDSSDSEFGCFTGYTDAPDKINNTRSRQLLEQLNIGSILFCDKCGNIIDSETEECNICDMLSNESTEVRTMNASVGAVRHTTSLGASIMRNDKGGLSSARYDIMVSDAADGNERSNLLCDIAGSGINLGTFTSGESPRPGLRKVTFDLKPDFENEEREFCRRRTRSIVIDAVSIYSKYISLEATHPFGLDEPLRRQVEANICSEDGKIDPECFIPAQKFSFSVMDRMYFPSFVRSSLYGKHQIDLLTGGKVFLSDILYNEHAMFYFMEFLEQEGIRHMLEFWLTADNFQSMFQAKLASGNYNGQQALDDAMVIYERYFSMQASLPLGIDDVTRIEIENSICREGGPLPDCLSLPMEHILCLLEEVFFPSFLQSDIYFKYLTELLNSVTDKQTTHASEATGEERGKEGRTDESTRLTTSFGSDLDLAENPDAIWHRPNAGSLSLGRVNEFGIFEPIFEPDPDSGNNISTAAKLGKAMRKLVSGGEDKAKEEMAWKIAKMMIEDVKSEQLKATSS